MNRPNLILVILLVAAFPNAVFSGERPSLRVEFRLEQEAFRVFYSDEIRDIEKQAGDRIGEVLQDRFGFFSFTSSQASDSLVIVLDNKEGSGSSSAMQEVGFQIEAEGTHVSEYIEPVYWTYRDESMYNYPLPKEAADFIEDIVLAFSSGLSSKTGTMVDNVLSKIAIAEDVLPKKKYSIWLWVLPFTREDLQIALKSRFRIVAQFISDIGDIQEECMVEASGIYSSPAPEEHPKYSSGILTRTVEESELLEDLLESLSPNIRGLYVIKYIPTYVKEETNKPEDLNTGGGSE
jgi:hypothetical protein